MENQTEDNLRNSQNVEANVSTEVVHDDVIISSKIKQSANADWLVKCLILWFIPFLGGIIFLEDEEPILRTSARQSLIISCLLVLSFILLRNEWNSFVFVGWLFLAGYAVLKLKSRKSIKISLVDDICNYIWNNQ